MACTLEKQVEAFARGVETEYAFPASLSVEERKEVKNAAKKFGLSSDSFGMGAERRIHIFQPSSSSKPALKPIVYSVKNTFVDEPVDPSQPIHSVAPATQSMPAGALQDHLSAEVAESCVADVLKESLEESPKEEVPPVIVSNQGLSSTAEDSAELYSEGETRSTVESDSQEANRERYSVKNTIKNTFIHFEETDAKENADPRIVQSMPNGKFSEAIQAEQAKTATAAVEAVSKLSSENPEESQGNQMMFPSTPNGESRYKDFPDGTPTVHWTPPQDPTISVLAPAVWNPTAPFNPMAPIVESSPTAAVSMPPVPMPPGGPPPRMAVGTAVVVCGLVNQPAFNGKHGTVSAFDESCGRYDIMLDMGAGSPKKMVKLKAENLVISQAPLMPMQSQVQPPMQPQVTQVQPQVQPQMLPQVQAQATGYEMQGWTNVGYEMPISNPKPALKLELMV
eukprot:gnl/MRDRNA2_/MRDRNA2_33323_c0_seq2.p1 gnl/MRDRNA2_/MRDRNA2_33323_c0~~gnl/MRDRNA2_/MRDRNA2_33323_c0_seq2.p1  ORF type:complete len:452 (-),score=114.49 gnl/MRDRNA2_/MRDRNA2_33323_c0_seq2:337-1692(-)